MIPIHPVTVTELPGIPVSGQPRFDRLPPLSLYVHIPWCIRKCPYCDFYSHEKHSTLPEKEYLDVLRQDLELSLPMILGPENLQYFIGGGTSQFVVSQRHRPAAFVYTGIASRSARCRNIHGSESWNF